MGNGKQRIVQRKIHNHKYFNSQNEMKMKYTNSRNWEKKDEQETNTRKNKPQNIEMKQEKLYNVNAKINELEFINNTSQW